MSEAQLQRGAIEMIRLLVPHALVVHCDAGATTASRRRARAKLGALPGFPDLLVMIPAGIGVAQILAIELKTPRGRLSPAQILMRRRFRAAGWPFLVARRLEDVEAILREHGAVRPSP